MASHATYSWEDPLNLDAQLTDDERAVRDAAHAYCQERLRSVETAYDQAVAQIQSR